MVDSVKTLMGNIRTKIVVHGLENYCKSVNSPKVLCRFNCEPSKSINRLKNLHSVARHCGGG